MQAYAELHPLGRGQYGAVSKVARHDEPGAFYAMKRLPMASKKDADAALREAALLHKLKHPNVIRYRESFVDANDVCIVMAYCDRGDLFTAIRKRREAAEEAGLPSRGFSERRVCTWFSQVAQGLDYVHSRRVLHRDLKTQNIFLAVLPEHTMMGAHANSAADDDAWVGVGALLGDFGIARVLDGTDEMATTVAGTPYYMAPEICMNKPYTLCSDVWSLGCVLYELCTLQHAFAADSLLSLVYQIVRGEVPRLPDEYRPELHAVVDALLQREASDRPGIADVLDAPFLASYLPGGRYERPKTAPKTPKAAPRREKSSGGMAAAAKNAKNRRAGTPSTGSRPGTSSSRPGTSSSSARPASAVDPRLDTSNMSTAERLKAKKIAEAQKREQELAEASRIQAADNAEAKLRYQAQFHGSSVPLAGAEEARRHAERAIHHHEMSIYRAQREQYEASRREVEAEQRALDRLAGPSMLGGDGGVADAFPGFATSSSDGMVGYASPDAPLSPSSGGGSLETDSAFVPVQPPEPPAAMRSMHDASPMDASQRRAMTAREYDELPLPRPGARPPSAFGGNSDASAMHYDAHDEDAGVLMATLTKATTDLQVSSGVPPPTLPALIPHDHDEVADTVDTDQEYEDDFEDDEEEHAAHGGVSSPGLPPRPSPAPAPIADDVRPQKNKRVEELRKRAVNALGEADFERVYAYLCNVDRNDNSINIKDDLINLVGKEKVNQSFLIDQLIFMESNSM